MACVLPPSASGLGNGLPMTEKQQLMPTIFDVGSGLNADDDDDDSEVAPHAAKKFKHNIAERRRTSRLNSLFDELSGLVASRPDVFCDTGMPGQSKADVLINSIHCVRAAYSRIDHLMYKLQILSGGAHLPTAQSSLQLAQFVPTSGLALAGHLHPQPSRLAHPTPAPQLASANNGP